MCGYVDELKDEFMDGWNVAESTPDEYEDKRIAGITDRRRGV